MAAVAITVWVLVSVTSIFAAQAPVIDIQPVSQTVGGEFDSLPWR